MKPILAIKDVKRSLMSIIDESAREGSINFGIGDPTYRLSDKMQSKIEELIFKDSNYGPVAGREDTRERLFNYYRDRKFCFEINPSSFVLTCGATEAIDICLKSLTSPGDQIIYPDPGYVLYKPAILLNKAIPVPLPLSKNNNFSIDISILKSVITPKTKAIILNSPSNPTGGTIDKKTLQEISKIAKKNNLIVISDEIYEFINFKGKQKSIAEYYKNTIVISGISKLYTLSGFRLGWTIANNKLTEELLKCHQYTTFRAPDFSQKTTSEIFKHTSEFTRIKDYYNKRRNIMLNGLKKIKNISFNAPEGTFFLYVDFSEINGGDDWKTANELLERGLITVPSTGPGEGFGNNGKGYIRLSFADASTKNIENGIKILHKYCKAKEKSNNI
ncbi:MAG: pyridoxal phosphate-dependent aminotransferase [Candidatus Aenigmarchaeota archaeon]|nr:pyridoxal phosphate-dependent aminotransferase [Candidatus Aenigmarchaeota archaeon]